MKQNRIRRVAHWLLWALSLASLCVSLATPTAESGAVLPFTAAWALAAVALWLGYRTLLDAPRPFDRASLWLLAALLSGVVTLGTSFSAVGTTELLATHKLKALLFFAGRLPTYYMGATLLGRALRDGSPSRHAVPAWACALLLLACWSPYLAIVWPGTVSNDSVTQLAQWFGTLPPSNGHPVFQTALLGSFVTVGRALGGDDAGITLYCCVQAALMAWLLACVLKRMRAMGAPGWLSRASFALYALCPVFPLFAFCVGKDTNFAMAVLWLTLCVERLWDEEHPSIGARMALIASALLCALLRNAGTYLAVLTLLCLLVHALRRRAGRTAPSVALGLTLAVALALRLLLLPAMNAAPTPETENWSVPLQQVARVAVSETLTDEERKTLSAVIDADALKGQYNGELSDPVKNLWNESATSEEKRAFFKLWLSLLRQYPDTCLSATFHNAYGYLYPGYVSTIKPTLLVGSQRRTTLLDGVFSYSVNPRAEAFRETLPSLYAYPLFRLLVAPGLYGWLTLWALFSALARRRGERAPALACLLPALFALAGCLFSAVNGYFRYAMPLYLCAPVALALAARRPAGLRP